jgi:hypothetical protein
MAVRAAPFALLGNSRKTKCSAISLPRLHGSARYTLCAYISRTTPRASIVDMIAG